jgi:hypothetical protein
VQAHAAPASRWGAAVRASAQLVLMVIQLYQGVVRAFQRCGKATSFVGANFTRAQLRPFPTDGTHTGVGEIQRLADTCMAR